MTVHWLPTHLKIYRRPPAILPVQLKTSDWLLAWKRQKFCTCWLLAQLCRTKCPYWWHMSQSSHKVLLPWQHNVTISLFEFGGWVKNQNSQLWLWSTERLHLVTEHQVGHQVQGIQGCCHISSAVWMWGMVSISETLMPDWPTAAVSPMLPDEHYLVR